MRGLPARGASVDARDATVELVDRASWSVSGDAQERFGERGFPILGWREHVASFWGFQ